MSGCDAGAVDDVGGQEHLHLAGDLRGRLVGGVALVAERGADPLGDAVEAVAAELERHEQRLLRALHLSGTSRPSARLSCFSASTR